MTEILGHIPNVQREAAAAGLPGIQPVGSPDWITVDECYAEQIALKQRLLAKRPEDVLQQLPEAADAVDELLSEVMVLLRSRTDFDVTEGWIICPDGRGVDVNDAPLLVLSQLLQEDLIIHQPMGDAHGMTAALLCFPASWTLAQKIGKPLVAIHNPVPEYDAGLAKRVQRLFDGVQVGSPMWRANLLRYDEPDLFQPREEGNPRPVGTDQSRYERSERQTLFRLPQTRAVVFAIHTVVAPA
jgi:hypothetical protein